MTNDEQPGPSERPQTAWARVLEDVLSSRADTFRRVTARLPERLSRRIPKKRFRSVAMPSMAGLGWRDRILFGFTGASILVALITIAIVVSDMLARGTP